MVLPSDDGLQFPLRQVCWASWKLITLGYVYSVVALHGLTGHAWNSFTTSSVVDADAGRTKETNWLRDILPRLLEQDRQQAIYPRVMTYGYDADVWMTRNVADLDVPVSNLLTYLDTERIDVCSLPITIYKAISYLHYKRIRDALFSSLGTVWVEL